MGTSFTHNMNLAKPDADQTDRFEDYNTDQDILEEGYQVQGISASAIDQFTAVYRVGCLAGSSTYSPATAGASAVGIAKNSTAVSGATIFVGTWGVITNVLWNWDACATGGPYLGTVFVDPTIPGKLTQTPSVEPIGVALSPTELLLLPMERAADAVGGGGGGITTITSNDSSVVITNPTGPSVDLSVSVVDNPQTLSTQTADFNTGLSTEHDMFTKAVPGGTMGTHGALHLRAHIQIANQGTGHTWTGRIYFGGTAMLSFAVTQGNEDIVIDVWVFNRNSQAQNEYSIEVWDMGAATTTPPVAASAATVQKASLQDQAIDTSTSQTFKLTGQWSGASGSDVDNLIGSVLEVYKNVA